jgi:trimethylamine:corrinoid methyltransferase-like protein
LLEGIQPRSESLAIAMFAETGLRGDFLRLKETRTLFRKEQHFPSAVVDRGLAGTNGAPDVLERARQRADELVSSYERHALPADREHEMITFAQREGKKAGLKGLPGIRALEYAGDRA